MKNILTKSLGATLGVFLLMVGVSAQATVIVIDTATNKATVDCTAGALDPACQGATGTKGSATWNNGFADIYDVTPNNEAQETKVFNELFAVSLGLKESDATKINTGGADSASFKTTAKYFSIKTGLGTSFFQNLAGEIDLSVVYKKSATIGQGMGISHVTFWGGSTTDVPEPGTLALLGMGILGFGLMRRRRAA